MISRSGQNSIVGGPLKKVSYAAFCDRIEAMIGATLPAWRAEFLKSCSNAHQKGEPHLTVSVCKFLNLKAREDSRPWSFTHEDPQKGSRSEDVTVNPGSTKGIWIEQTFYRFDERFYTIEAKRLPAPEGRKKKGGKKEDRTREYVCGDWGQAGELTKRICGGIERFKENEHGRGLTRGGMVAFIQDQTPQHWLGAVNGWIGDLVGDPCPCPRLQPIWVTGDELSMVAANNSAVHTEYTSLHARGGGVPAIALRHFWIDLTAQSQPVAGQSEEHNVMPHLLVELHDDKILDGRKAGEFLPPLLHEEE